MAEGWTLEYSLPEQTEMTPDINEKSETFPVSRDIDGDRSLWHLTISRIQSINAVRSDRWHDGDMRQWSALEWAGAMCGEAGEAANITKKMRRFDFALPGNAYSDHAIKDDAGSVLRDMLAHELADTFLYMTLLATRCEINLARAIRDRFNEKSEQMGFPERL